MCNQQGGLFGNPPTTRVCGGCCIHSPKPNLVFGNIHNEAYEELLAKIRRHEQDNRKKDEEIQLLKLKNRMLSSSSKQYLFLTENYQPFWQHLFEWSFKCREILQSITQSSPTVVQDIKSMFISDQRQLIKSIEQRLVYTIGRMLDIYKKFQEFKKIELDYLISFDEQILETIEIYKTSLKEEKLDLSIPMVENINKSIKGQIICVKEKLKNVSSLKQEIHNLKYTLKLRQ